MNKKNKDTKIPDVVRCYECIHRTSRIDHESGVLIACYKMNDNDFCSRGIRLKMKI